MRRGRMLLTGCALALIASFAAAAEGPWLRYDPSIFADECVAPDLGDGTCRTLYGEIGETGLSASAALLPVEGRQPQSEPQPQRLRYELAGLIDLDGHVTYQAPRRRPGS